MSIAEYLHGRDIQANETDRVISQEETSTRHIDLVDITEKARPYGDQPLVILTSSYLKAKDNLGKYDDYALLVKRKVDSEGYDISTTLEIRSLVVRNALKLLLSTYGYLNLEACPIEIKKPYDALFHYRHEIREYAKAPERDIDSKKHLDVLVKFMNTNLLATERLYAQMVPKGMIDFENLWTLYRAEDIVISQIDHYEECYRVISCTTITIDGNRFFELHVWRWGYNGYKFGPVEERLKIAEFSVPRKILLLPYYPLNLTSLEEQDSYRRKFVQRGRLWKAMVDVRHMQYEGPIWTDPPTDPAAKMSDLVMTHIKSRVILDHRSHERENYRLATSLHGSGGSILSPSAISRVNRGFSSYADLINADLINTGLIRERLPIPSNGSPETLRGSLNDMKCYNNDEDYEITEEQAVLAPARVRGFALSNKRWAFFLVTGLDEIRWNHDAFAKLEIAPVMKTYIQALVESHSLADNDFDDLITDKGKGLILLLHGPPGTGKTLTAESIAELTRKPLYHIGTGELGTQVSYTEPVLTKIFNYAKDWGAILLLDEADCFLSKRTTDDMERNAFVTIFLRLLEYYQGILFLTTNRIEEFDSAFQSRIHLAIEYHELDAARRVCVWKNLLACLPACADWDEGVYKRLGEYIVVNGREIKNLIRTTLAITQHTGGLTEEALMTVYKLNFKRYIGGGARS